MRITNIFLTSALLFASASSVLAEDNGRLNILFGHQDDTFYGIGWDARNGGKPLSDIKRVCGDYPAVMGFELGGLELGNGCNLDGVPFSLMRQEIKKQLERGGIVTISWHPYNPLTGDNAWDVSDSTVVRNILPGGTHHEMFKDWMKRIAEFLSSLPIHHSSLFTLHSPLILRPWHENNGSWFWWGKNLCTPAEYKALWNMFQDYMQKECATEFVWSYSPNYDSSLTEQDFLTRYPGNDRVQLIGLDAYQNGSREEFQSLLDNNLTMLCNYAARNHKPVALTECGYRSVPDDTWWTGALLPVIEKYPLQYVLCWRNGDLKERFAPYKGSNDSKDFKRFAKRMIMLKQLK